VHERLLLILSPSSIHSEWVKTEIAKARKREVLEKRRMLFPVMLKIGYKELTEWECFDADTGKDSAREIREYYIPDFSQWESPEKYNEEFEKLVRDLKKAEAAAAEAG
jgi:TIR domain